MVPPRGSQRPATDISMTRTIKISEFRNLGLNELPLKPAGPPADVAGGSFCEMRSQAERVILRSIGKDPVTRSSASFGKFAVNGTEIRTIYLQWMMHDIAGKKSFLSVRAKTNGSVVDAMSGCW